MDDTSAVPAARKRQELQSHLRDAMRARDANRVGILRNLIAAIDNGEAVVLPVEAPREGPRTRAISEHVAVTGDGPAEIARRDLTTAEIALLLEGEIASMQSAAEERRLNGARLQADELDAKAEIARAYI